MKTALTIQNLKCGGCETTIKERLSEMEGISNVSVDLKDSIVIITHEKTQDSEEAQKRLSKLGYPIIGDKNSLGKKAKSYVSCAIGRMHDKN